MPFRTISSRANRGQIADATQVFQRLDHSDRPRGHPEQRHRVAHQDRGESHVLDDQLDHTTIIV